MNPTTITYDDALFRQQVPEYADTVAYPPATVQNWWNIGTNYMSTVGNYGCFQGSARILGLNLLAAHFIYLNGLIAAGQVPGLMQNATIDKVTVGLTPPPLKNQFQWWLSLTPYGQMLFAMLQVSSVGGFYYPSPMGGISGFQPVRGGCAW